MSPALVAAISDSRSPSTWNQYLGPLRAWVSFAGSHGSAWLPADPLVFADFLATQGAGDVGYSQTKARCCAIDAPSTLAGVPSPARHPLVAAVRAGALRTKRHRRGAARPVFAQEIPLLASPLHRGAPPTRGGHAGGRTGGGRSARSQRARCAAAGHMAVLHDGAFRYDDTLEGQLGDVLFFPDVVDVSIFGSKTDPTLAGQPGALPREGPGASALLLNARHGLERLLAGTPRSCVRRGTASTPSSGRRPGQAGRPWLPGRHPSQAWRIAYTPPAYLCMCSRSSAAGCLRSARRHRASLRPCPPPSSFA